MCCIHIAKWHLVFPSEVTCVTSGLYAQALCYTFKHLLHVKSFSLHAVFTDLERHYLCGWWFPVLKTLDWKELKNYPLSTPFLSYGKNKNKARMILSVHSFSLHFQLFLLLSLPLCSRFHPFFLPFTLQTLMSDFVVLGTIPGAKATAMPKADSPLSSLDSHSGRIDGHKATN